MIATTVAMHDVHDAEGFVAHFIHRSRIRLSAEDREELMAEGLAILAQLASKFERHRDGYAQAGTFSGYAGSLLPKRLDDAYRKLHPEQRKVRGPDGRRAYDYAQKPPASIFAEDMPELVASAYIGPHPYDELPACPTVGASAPYVIEGRVASAIAALPTHDRGPARRIVQYVDFGLGTDEIARRTGLRRSEVTELREQLVCSYYSLEAEEAA